MVQLARSQPAAALLALATHYLLHSGEWDNSFHILLGIWTVGFSGLAVSEYIYNPRPDGIVAAAKVSAASAAVYFGVLMASIFVHRAFFHRLRNVRIGTPQTDLGFLSLTFCIDSGPVSRADFQALQRVCGRASGLSILQEE